jgi:hypothetical protein
VTNPGEENETWASAAGSAQFQLDLNNIPEALSDIAVPMGTAYANIVQAIGIANAVLKLLCGGPGLADSWRGRDNVPTRSL